MRKILIAAMLAISLNAFAAWPKMNDLGTSNVEELKEKYSGILFIPNNKTENGFNIAGFSNKGFSIHLKYHDGIVDYIIAIYEKCNETATTIYIELLDENGFLIEEIKTQAISAEFTGNLRGKFNLNWDKFSHAKAFDLSSYTK